MSSAAFSVPHDPRPRISLRHRVKSAQTETSSAADEALQQVLNRRALKRDGRLPSRQPAAAGPLAEVRESLARVASGQTLLRGAVLGIVALVLWGALSVMYAAPPAEPRHAVQGTLVLNGKPLTNSIVEFHRVGAEADAETSFIEVAYTDGDGRFAFGTSHSPGLPAGEYAVVARGRRRVIRRGESVLEPIHLPKPYTVAASTPLKVTVSADVSGVQLAIRK